QGHEPLERVTGSLAFGALARMVLATCRIEFDDDEPTYLLTRAKANIARDGGGFTYAIQQANIDQYSGLSTNRIEWGDEIEGSPTALLTSPNPQTKKSKAVAFLRELLANTTLEKDAVRQATGEAGFAWRTIQRAMRDA